MRQALNIFRKDSRQFRIPIAIMLAWTVLFAAAMAYPWREAIFQLPEEYRRRTLWAGLVRQVAYFFFPAAWCFLMAKVLHAESLVGERAFWLTRPYHRGSLAAAKAIFVLVYITLPLAVAQAAIVIRSGLPLTRHLPGLLWEQLLITLLILLPAAALAALTSRLSQFVLVALTAPVLVGLGGVLPGWYELGWVRATVFVAGVSVLAGAVLVIQFRRRRAPASRLVALAGTLVILVVLSLLPWPAAFAVQARVQRAWEGPLTVDVVRGHAVGAWAGVARGLQLEFRLRGLPAGVAVMCRADEIAVRTGDGTTRRRDIHFSRTGPSEVQSCHVSVPLPSAFLDPIADVPSTLEAVLYVTVLGPARTVAVPVGGPRIAVPGGSMCAAGLQQWPTAEGLRDFTWVECRTAFRDPAALVRWQEHDLGELSLSPWPAAYRLSPVTGWTNSEPGKLQAVPLTVREPIAHLRTAVTAEHIRLRDFEFRP